MWNNFADGLPVPAESAVPYSAPSTLSNNSRQTYCLPAGTSTLNYWSNLPRNPAQSHTGYTPLPGQVASKQKNIKLRGFQTPGGVGFELLHKDWGYPSGPQLSDDRELPCGDPANPLTIVYRPIIQKVDFIRDPDRPNELLSRTWVPYVSNRHQELHMLNLTINDPLPLPPDVGPTFHDRDGASSSGPDSQMTPRKDVGTSPMSIPIVPNTSRGTSTNTDGLRSTNLVNDVGNDVGHPSQPAVQLHTVQPGTGN